MYPRWSTFIYLSLLDVYCPQPSRPEQGVEDEINRKTGAVIIAEEIEDQIHGDRALGSAVLCER